MGEKLAVKHKNSLILKENKSLQEKHKTRSFVKKFASCDLLSFPVITCSLFACYWFILCPLLFILVQSFRTRSWPTNWPFLYWLVALLVWLLVMLFLILLWRRYKNKQNRGTMTKSYGTSSVEPANANQIYRRDTRRKSNEILENNEAGNKENDRKSSNNPKASQNSTKKYKDLPPLLIHRGMSGNDVENPGTVKMEDRSNEDGATDPLLQGKLDCINNDRDSMKEYLKLVTVTPSADDTDIVKSPKSPLTPRELFFIDLIREAEKAESGKDKNPECLEGKHFFPKNFSPTEGSEGEDKGSDEKDRKAETEKEASYFIANVESPLSEKSEVFLEISPETETAKEWLVKLGNEKPILILSESEETPEARQNDPPKEGVVLFEV